MSTLFAFLDWWNKRKFNTTCEQSYNLNNSLVLLFFFKAKMPWYTMLICSEQYAGTKLKTFFVYVASGAI